MPAQSALLKGCKGYPDALPLTVQECLQQVLPAAFHRAFCPGQCRHDPAAFLQEQLLLVIPVLGNLYHHLQQLQRHLSRPPLFGLLQPPLRLHRVPSSNGLLYLHLVAFHMAKTVRQLHRQLGIAPRQYGEVHPQHRLILPMLLIQGFHQSQGLARTVLLVQQSPGPLQNHPL